MQAAVLGLTQPAVVTADAAGILPALDNTRYDLDCFAKGLAYVEGNRGFLIRSIERFLTEVDTLRSELRDCNDGDLGSMHETIDQVSHKLISLSGVIGFNATTPRIKDLNQAAQKGLLVDPQVRLHWIEFFSRMAQSVQTFVPTHSNEQDE